MRRKIEVLNVDRLAYRIVRQARGTPVIADERVLRDRWAKAVAEAGLAFTPAFGKNEWEQVILAQDLRTEQAYLTCPRTGRGRPLSKAHRGQVWQAAQLVTAELAAAGQSTHLQLAGEAALLLRQAGAPRYRHILVDEAQDLHPSQWRLLRAAVALGPDDLFIAADPHQRVYDNRVSLASLGISVRGRSRRLSLNYRTTQEILAWAVPLLGTDPVTGLDGEVDSLLGYRSPMHGPRPERRVTATRAEEFKFLAERVRSWLSAGLEPHAIGVAARSASLVRDARAALAADGIATISLSGRENTKAVRAGTMHAMKGLEFQAVAVIGVEQGLVPEPAAVTPETEDAAAHAQDLQRERCILFVACTRARDHLYVSGTGQPSIFLPSGEVAAPPPPEPDRDLHQILTAASLPRLFRLLLSRRRLDPGMDAESFLAWATAPGRRLRLAALDVAARRFLTEGGDQALDLADRCLDLLDRLTGRDPDLAGARLPRPFVDAARKETIARAPGQPAARRTESTPPRPRVRLDPNEAAVQVILPAIVPGMVPGMVASTRRGSIQRSRHLAGDRGWRSRHGAEPRGGSAGRAPADPAGPCRPRLAGRLGSRDRAGSRAILGPGPVLRRGRQAPPGAAAPAPGPAVDPASGRPRGRRGRRVPHDHGKPGAVRVGRLAPGARFPGAGQLRGPAGRPGACRARAPTPSPPARRAAPGRDHAGRLTRVPGTTAAVASRRGPLARRHPARDGRHLPGVQGNQPGRPGRHLGRRAQAHPGIVRHHRARSAGPRDEQDDLRGRRR